MYIRKGHLQLMSHPDPTRIL
jgi:hypothetical protein